jgi:hypothetical protein
MAISMSAFIGTTLSLLLVSGSAGSSLHGARQANLRHAKVAGRNPEASDRNGDQEAVTREEMLEQSAPESAPNMIPAANFPALAGAPQLSQLQQMQQMQQMQQQVQQMGQPQQAVDAAQAQQLLQAQALQMKQMQLQMKEQEAELLRLQQHAQPPPPPPQAVAQAPKQVRKKSLVGVNAQVMTKTEMESGTASGSGGGNSRPKGWDQCLKFARFVKGQDVTGIELTRVWMTTCEPAVNSGRATARYKLMCNSLSGVVEPYAAQIDYDVEQLCDSVLAVFHDVTAQDAKSR